MSSLTPEAAVCPGAPVTLSSLRTSWWAGLTAAGAAGTSGLLWLLALGWVASLAFLFCGHCVLPIAIPISRSGTVQRSQVEVRTPIEATHVETQVALSETVSAGCVICCVTNAFPDTKEIRDLEQKRRTLEASLVLTRQQRKTAEQNLAMVSADLTAFLELTAQALQASRARLLADLDAARADHQNAAQSARRLNGLTTAVTIAEREDADARVQIAAARITSLTAELTRLRAEEEGIERGVPLGTNVDFIARKADFAWRCTELAVKEEGIQADQAALAARRLAAQDEVARRSEARLVAPCDGRVTWVHATAGAVRANEPLVRISQRETQVDALFAARDADRIAPGQAALVALATGESCTGRVERFEESSPNAAPPGSTIAIPRQPDQIRVHVVLDPLPDLEAVRAGVPASVALTDQSWVRHFLANYPTRWLKVGVVLFTLLLLAVKAGHARLVHAAEK